jgi:hypothetical protein
LACYGRAPLLKQRAALFAAHRAELLSQRTRPRGASRWGAIQWSG